MTGRSLQQFPEFAAFPIEQLDRLADKFSLHSRKRGEIIFVQGEPARHLFLLLLGRMRATHIVNAAGRSVTIAFYGPGNIFGLNAFSPHGTYLESTDAFEDCTFASIGPADYTEILLGVKLNAMQAWYGATVKPRQQILFARAKIVGVKLRERLALELINLAERFGVEHDRGTAIDLKVSHEDLAGLVGGSRQQITEYLNEFDDKNLISRLGRRVIVHAQLLREVIVNEN